MKEDEFLKARTRTGRKWRELTLEHMKIICSVGEHEADGGQMTRGGGVSGHCGISRSHVATEDEGGGVIEAWDSSECTTS